MDSIIWVLHSRQKKCHSRRLSVICTPTHPDPTANLNSLFFFPLFIYASHLDLRLSPVTAGTFWPWGFHTCKCPSTASLPLISPSNQNYHPLPPIVHCLFKCLHSAYHYLKALCFFAYLLSFQLSGLHLPPEWGTANSMAWYYFYAKTSDEFTVVPRRGTHTLSSRTDLTGTGQKIFLLLYITLENTFDYNIDSHCLHDGCSTGTRILQPINETTSYE